MSRATLTLVLALVALLGGGPASAQQHDARPGPWAGYAKVLPETLAAALPIDQAKGILTIEVKPGVHVVTDGIWQSAFVTTGKGVIVFDAPESYAAKLPQAIAEVTDEPIRMLVYSHAHKDHIGGSAVFSKITGLEIVALDSVKHFLEEQQDPNRLIPTKTFSGQKTIRLGSKRIELSNRRNYHSDEGDLFIYLPADRSLMVIEVDPQERRIITLD